MTFGSLFAGIGGFDLGLERAGMTCKWQVEIDDYALKVLTRHWPDVHKYRDVRDFPPAESEFPDYTPWNVDLICGGFPCQNISRAAGKGRKYLDGEKSGLWHEMFRVICCLMPTYVLVENSPEILISGLDRVLGDMASLGYDAEWEVLPAAAFGSPQLRERLFLVCYPSSQRQSAVAVHDEASGVPSILHRDGGCMSHVGLPIEDQRTDWDNGTDQPYVLGVAHGVSNRVHRCRGLGNAVVPQIAEWIGRRILEHSQEGARDRGSTTSDHHDDG